MQMETETVAREFTRILFKDDHGRHVGSVVGGAVAAVMEMDKMRSRYETALLEIFDHAKVNTTLPAYLVGEIARKALNIS